jgi:subtilase family serine protease
LVGAVNQHSTFGTGDEIAANLATPPQGWANTATQAFKLYTGPATTDLGALPASKQLSINLALQMHNAAQLKSLVASGQTIGDAQFLATYAPTQAETQQAISYLTSMGFTNVAADPNRLLVSARGTAAQIDKAFNTSLHLFSAGSSQIYGNTTPALVPSNLGGIVVAVLGLNNVQAQTFIRYTASTQQQGTAPPNPAPTPEPCTITAVPFVPVLLNVPEPPNPVTPPVQPPPPLPQIPTVPGIPVPASSTVCERNFYANEYPSVYDAQNLPANTRFSEAVLGAGDPSLAVGDLHTNESYLGMPLTNVTVRNGTKLPTSGNQGDDEWTLDMLSSTGLGGGAPGLVFYAAPDASDNSLEATINKWATGHHAPIMNASLGLCEVQPWLDGAMHAVDQTLLYAAASGQTLFASTGDSGSQCFIEAVGENGYPGDFPDVEWPAASSYSVAVGGTSLFSQQDLSYGGENAWNEGGGGISYFEYEPSWGGSQQYVGGILLDNPGRGLPDVAMDADLDTGIFIYLSTISGATGGPGWYVSGGTSLASPLAMGMFDRIMTADSKRFYVPPMLYQIYTNKIGTGAPPNPSALCLGPPPTACFSQGPPPTENIAGFHDVLTGENNFYQALPGYDYTTGLGSIDGTNLAASAKTTIP